MASNQSPSGRAVEPEPGTSPAALVPLRLEVTQGRTRFPERPVPGPRFLIGADERCDLRLGGEGIPSLHSIITINGPEICLEALSENPPLFVNDRQVTSAVLWDGDLIRIGAIELRARVTELLPGGAPAQVPVTAEPQGLEDADLDLADLSAAELIELIEREEAEVAQFERRQRLGARALLETLEERAAQRSPARHQRHAPEERIRRPHFLGTAPARVEAPRAAEKSAAPPTPAADLTQAELLRSIEELGQALHQISQELQRRSERATEREAGYVAATTTLVETQQQLVSQMELLTEQVQSMQSTPAERLKRAIA